MPERTAPGRSITPLLAVLAAVLLALPAAASAHSRALGDGDAPLDPAAAASLEREQAEALAALPRETASGTCRDTDRVDGIGLACRTEDGLFRVLLPGGRSVATHGGDAPAAESQLAAPHLPDTQTAINTADVSDIECVTGASESRIEIVYAYPSNQANRSATLAGPLRQEIYRASAFVDAESQAVDPNQGRRLRIGCTAGVPTINVAAVRASTGAGEQFGNIVADLVAQGYPAADWDSSSPRRFIVFYDARSANGSAGIGTLWSDDDLVADNLNNRGGRYAVEFDWSGSHLPHWDIMLHEMSHNMGATSDNAPDSSLAGHCIDGLDVMCYSDGGAGGTYTSTSCAVERFDCGNDTYFNPTPTPGSYLATHWNIASPLNNFIEPWDSGWNDGGVPDTTAPTVPTGLATSAVGNSSISLTWSASTDARSTVRYRAFVDRSSGGSWVLDSTWAPIAATTLTVTPLTSGTNYRVRLVAYDQAGNTSAETSITATTTSGPPTAPGAITLAAIDEDSFSASWLAGSAGAGVRGYELGLQVGTSTWATLGEVPQTSATIFQLEPGSTYHLRVRTVANGGAVSSWRVSDAVTLPGTLRGDGNGAPQQPTVSAAVRGLTGATVSWTADPSAGSWDLRITSPTGATVRSIGGLTETSAVVSGLNPGTTYGVSVIAWSEDGEVASAAGTTTFTTPRDTVAPGVVKLARRPVWVRGTIRVAWLAAVDNAGIRSYQLERKVGARWVRLNYSASARAGVVTKVPTRSLTSLRIRAVDVAGNAGRWTSFSVLHR